MISTMPKSGEAPSSPNAMPGGLGALLQQPGGAPKGASSRNIQAMIDSAKGMSDMQLADVLSGKSLDVPQYVAMTEAMGRKSLRTAVQGAQAQQQVRQPSVKDKLLADEAAAQMAQLQQAGLDQLPAPNMESVDMASGGIVAFSGADGDQQVEDSFGPQVSGFDKRLWNAIKEKFGEWNQPWGKTVDATPAQVRGALTGKNLKENAATTPTISNTPTQAEIDAIRSTDTALKPDALGRYVAGSETPSAAPKSSGSAPAKAGIAALVGDEDAKQAEQSYLAKLMGVGEKTRGGIEELKRQGQGEALMNLAGALFSSPNMSMALSKGLPLVASTAAASRKDQRALQKEANEYDLNLARYQDALASGDKDRAMQYQKMMLENKYHMAMVNKPGEAMQLLNALSDPEKMKLYQEMNAAKKPMNIVSKDTALKEWGDMLPSQKRQYGNDFNAFYGSLSGSTMGGGSDLASAAAAELARRNK